jgi:hypothetical protein
MMSRKTVVLIRHVLREKVAKIGMNHDNGEVVETTSKFSIIMY